MFFKGNICQCTYNKYGALSHYQLSLCCHVPQQIVLDIFQRIKMLVYSPTIKYDEFIFDFDLLKDYYIQIGFKEVSIGQAPEQIVFYNTLNLIRRQYGWHDYVIGSIHSRMGDTYNRMAIWVNDIEKYFPYGIAVS